MRGYESTSLWQKTLAPQPDDAEEEPRARLRAAYLGFRERAAILAAEIPQDLREFTVHDATHIDALWETAEAVAGSDFALTPVEAFVFGGACLIHDLGMGLAAYPDGLAQLQKGPEWADALASNFYAIHGTWPSPTHDQYKDDPLLRSRTKEQLLRELHAERAESLALISWNSSISGSTYHLIDDTDLRSSFGSIVGRIAASHGWDVNRLPEEFPQPFGAPVGCPSTWTVDPLKLACLLRLADICHRDSRRAPGFLAALRGVDGHSGLHWNFQSHLQQVRRDGDRLIFSATRPFNVDDAQAWWLCFDTLQSVQRELHDVDAVLADRHRPRFAVRAVFGAESPRRLSETIPTEGWTPIDARVTIQDVPALVRKLGGEELYGPQEIVGLRELVQNAMDATLAWAAFSNQAPAEIEVKLSMDDDGYWLTVSDTGIGMSKDVLGGALLDFGTSYWGSDLMRRESPGLMSSSFEPTGKYGIGFYSTFMLGDVISVTTRRQDQGKTETHILEFREGLISRPLMRLANPREQLTVGGTSVKVLLNDEPHGPYGLLDVFSGRTATLGEACSHTFPGSPVNIRAVDEIVGCSSVVIIAKDWESLSPKQLIDRICAEKLWPIHEKDLESVSRRMRSIHSSDGLLIGRGAMCIERLGSASTSGTVATNGIRGGNVQGFAGLLLGQPSTASRGSARPTVAPEVLADWATEQGRLISEEVETAERLLEFSAIVNKCLGETGSLPIAVSGKARRAVNYADLVSSVRDLSSLTIFSDSMVSYGPSYLLLNDDGTYRCHTDEMLQVDLLDTTIVIVGSPMFYLIDTQGALTWPSPQNPREYAPVWTPDGWAEADGRSWWFWNSDGINGLIGRALCDGWGCTLDSLLEISEQSKVMTRQRGYDQTFEQDLGVNSAGATISAVANIKFNRPQILDEEVAGA